MIAGDGPFVILSHSANDRLRECAALAGNEAWSGGRAVVGTGSPFPPSACARWKELLKSLAGYPGQRAELAGVLLADGAPFRSDGMEAGEKRPGLPRPSRVEQGVMPVALLVRQFGESCG